MREERIFFYSILEKRISSKRICNEVNHIPSNQNKNKCIKYEGGGIWIKTYSNPYGLKQKMEREFNISFGNPKN